jgi:hypothetical protein
VRINGRGKTFVIPTILAYRAAAPLIRTASNAARPAERFQQGPAARDARAGLPATTFDRLVRAIVDLECAARSTREGLDDMDGQEVADMLDDAAGHHLTATSSKRPNRNTSRRHDQTGST